MWLLTCIVLYMYIHFYDMFCRLMLAQTMMRMGMRMTTMRRGYTRGHRAECFGDTQGAAELSGAGIHKGPQRVLRGYTRGRRAECCGDTQGAAELRAAGIRKGPQS